MVPKQPVGKKQNLVQLITLQLCAHHGGVKLALDIDPVEEGLFLIAEVLSDAKGDNREDLGILSGEPFGRLRVRHLDNPVQRRILVE